MAINARINPSTSVVHGVMEGSALNNEALRLERMGDLSGAERLHLQAIQMKEETIGVDDVTTALSYNGLGELYLTMDNLDKAEEYLVKALHVREIKGPNRTSRSLGTTWPGSLKCGATWRQRNRCVAGVQLTVTSPAGITT